MAVAIDTNILGYALGIERNEKDAPKIELCRDLLAALVGRVDLLVPVQVLAELYRILVRYGFSRKQAFDDIAAIQIYAEVLPSTTATFDDALHIAVKHKLQIFDSIVISAAADRRARWLLSEDMHSGWRHRGVVIFDPIGKPVSETLRHLGI